jgi:hypothetical protein
VKSLLEFRLRYSEPTGGTALRDNFSVLFQDSTELLPPRPSLTRLVLDPLPDRHALEPVIDEAVGEPGWCTGHISNIRCLLKECAGTVPRFIRFCKAGHGCASPEASVCRTCGAGLQRLQGQWDPHQGWMPYVEERLHTAFRLRRFRGLERYVEVVTVPTRRPIFIRIVGETRDLERLRSRLLEAETQGRTLALNRPHEIVGDVVPDVEADESRAEFMKALHAWGAVTIEEPVMRPVTEDPSLELLAAPDEPVDDESGEDFYIVLDETVMEEAFDWREADQLEACVRQCLARLDLDERRLEKDSLHSSVECLLIRGQALGPAVVPCVRRGSTVRLRLPRSYARRLAQDGLRLRGGGLGESVTVYPVRYWQKQAGQDTGSP